MKITFTILIIVFCGQAYCQNIGIGTTTPVARLHVSDSNVVFTGPINVLPTTNFYPPVQGPGARMMWYAEKAAFRVGFVDGAHWDKDSIGNYSLATGFRTKARGIASTAMGESTYTTGRATMATNYYSSATGDYSLATGYYSKASGVNSTAFGFVTMASGNNATAMGGASLASGSSSTAMGYGTEAAGDYTTAMGLTTSAKGVGSTAAGWNTKAKSAYSFVVGKYNDTTAIASLFEVGNGASDISRSNAMIVSSNGYVWIQGALTQNSDARLKKNIYPLQNVLSSIRQISGYTYNWKDESRDKKEQIGVLAQELQAIYPQLVTQNNKGELSVNYIGLIPVLLEGIKEQQKEIEVLRQQVGELISERVNRRK